MSTTTSSEKTQIRKQVRRARRQLTPQQQTDAAQAIADKITDKIKTITTQQGTQQTIKIAIFLSMDGEIGTKPTIEKLWQTGINVYLPRIHPFNPKQLIFIQYNNHTQLIKSHLGMLEPQLDCSQLCPLMDLDVILTPLVAFDKRGHRLGMGGGFYDRTLAPLYNQNRLKPQIIGIAHDCQQVTQIPIEPWDIPLKEIITPNQHIKV